MIGELSCIWEKKLFISIYDYPLITEKLQGPSKNEKSRHTSNIQPKCVSPSTYFVLKIVNV